MGHPDNTAVLWGPQVRVGTEQEDMRLCHLGTPGRHLRSIPHTLALEEVGRTPAGFPETREVAVGL